MYLLFFVLWIIFNGKVTTEIVIFGLVIAAVMYAFICKFMDYSIQKEIKYLKKAYYLFQYMIVVMKEIVKANFATMKLLLSANYAIEPVIIHFETRLQSNTAKFLLANSITLTPGTITVDIEENKFVVHCLDKTMAEGIESSVFVELLEKIEGIGEGNE